MATMGLFTDPAQLQEARLMQQAQMDPNQRLYMMAARGGQQLGQGVGSLFGVDVQDPAIARATKLRELGAKYGTTTAESLDKIAQELQATDPQMAMQVAEKANELRLTSSKITAEQALAAQRMRERQSADPFQQFLRSAVGKVTPESLAKYRETSDPADLEWTDKGAKGAAMTELGKLLQERSQLDPVKDKESYDAYNAKIKKLTTGGGIGSEIAAGLGPIMGAIAKGQAQKSGETGGAAVGKETAAIQGKYTALSSIKDALDVVERGIYAGGYGPMEEALAKYGAGVVGNKNRLVNTEEFRAYIGDVVIPRLQEFGGNDSVEELKYLRSVMAGETTLEKASIERILKNADKKIRSGIQRLEAQQKAIGKGEQLPVGPLGGKQFTTKSGVVYTKEE